MSTDVSRPSARLGEAERAAGDPLHLARVVLAGVEDGAVGADAVGAEVEAADELAHDQHVDAVAVAGRRFAYVSSSARSRSMPCSGRTSAASNSGSPIGAFSTAVAPRHAASVSSGSGEPVARIAAAPSRRVDQLDLRRERTQRAHRLSQHLRPDAVAGEADDDLSHPRALPAGDGRGAAA